MFEISEDMASLPSLKKTQSTSYGLAADASRSVQKERGRILSMVRCLFRLVRNFDRKLAENEDEDYGDIHEHFIRHVVKASEGELVDWRDLRERVIRRFRADADVSSRRDFGRLEALVDLAKTFHAAFNEFQRTLQTALNECDVYLASHGEEAAGRTFRGLERYESLLADCRDALIDGLGRVRHLVTAVESVRPLTAYLADHAKVMHYMREARECAEECAGALQRWLVGDEVYVNDVSSELCSLLQKRKELASLIPAHAAFKVLNSDRRAGDAYALGEVIGCKERRLQELTATLSSVEESLRAAQRALSEASAQRAAVGRDARSRRWDSGALRSTAPQAWRVAQDVATLRERASALRAHAQALREDADGVQRWLSSSKSELQRRGLEAAALRRKEAGDQKAAVANARSVRDIDAAIAALQRILSLKRSSETLKLAEGNVAQSLDFNAILEEAVHRCSQTVGRKWPLLYASLTFVPERSEEQLLADIQGVRHVGERLGHSDVTMARAALSRWAKASQTASAGELSFVCKKVLLRGQLCQGCGSQIEACRDCALPRIARFSSLSCS